LEDVFAEKNKLAQEGLNKWASHEDSRRGLERWSNKDHGEKRQQEQFQVIMAVLRAQDDMIMEKKVDPEQLRKVSYKATKVARNFARMIGKANSHAVSAALKDDDDVSLQTVLSHLSKQTENSSLKGVLKLPEPEHDELTAEIDVMSIDDLKDSCHTAKSSRRLRFGFGRKHRDIGKVEDTKIRVS
jgi:hypothetical protein